MSDIQKVLGNLNQKERDTLLEIAISMLKNRQEAWTGATLWTFHTSEGAIGDAVERRERSLFRKKRT